MVYRPNYLRLEELAPSEHLVFSGNQRELIGCPLNAALIIFML